MRGGAVTGAAVPKRRILGRLTRQELIAAVDRAGIDIDDRGTRAGLADGLARSVGVDLADILARLSRSRVKELCRQLGIDDSGREKAVLIERLVALAAQADGHVTLPLNGSPSTPRTR